MEDDEASPGNSYNNFQNSNHVVVDSDDEEEVIGNRSNRNSNGGPPPPPPPPPKRIRIKPRKPDRLCNLPESMITHILSFMPVIEAVKTQLISKRFRHLWASIPTLVFGSTWVGSDEFNAQFISNVLMLHRGPSIKKFKVSRIVPSSDNIEPPVNLWVQAVVIKQVEELVLNIYDRGLSFSFPICLLVCDTLRKLSLSASKIELGLSVCWKSLTKLTLKSMDNLSDDMIRNILIGSPALESFRLIECWGFSRVLIDSSSSNLKHLVIDCEYPYSDYRRPSVDVENDVTDYFLDISAPKVTNLEISGDMGNKFCRLKEVSPSLARVALRFSMVTMVGNYSNQTEKSIDDASRAKLEKCEWALLDLLRKISHADKLRMGTWCTQVLSLCELRRKPGIFLKCKMLEVDAFYARSLPGIARLMKTSPYLHTLIIDMNTYDDEQVRFFYEFSDFRSENYWESQATSLRNALQCLKVVRLMGSDNDRTSDTTDQMLLVELSKFLLKNAKFLEELEYKPGDYAYYEQSDFKDTTAFNVIKKLLRFPRSSPHARVLLL